MCKRFDENRRKLASLVLSKKAAFTTQGIIDEFMKTNGDILIDGNQTIGGYIRLLREDGILRYKNGKYQLAT
jgi:hypothetical protein